MEVLPTNIFRKNTLPQPTRKAVLQSEPCNKAISFEPRLWIEKYGPVCHATQRNKTKIYAAPFTDFHQLSDLSTMHSAWYMLQNQKMQVIHMKPGHIWNKPSLM